MTSRKCTVGGWLCRGLFPLWPRRAAGTRMTQSPSLPSTHHCFCLYLACRGNGPIFFSSAISTTSPDLSMDEGGLHRWIFFVKKKDGTLRRSGISTRCRCLTLYLPLQEVQVFTKLDLRNRIRSRDEWKTAFSSHAGWQNPWPGSHLRSAPSLGPRSQRRPSPIESATVHHCFCPLSSRSGRVVGGGVRPVPACWRPSLGHGWGAHIDRHQALHRNVLWPRNQWESSRFWGE